MNNLLKGNKIIEEYNYQKNNNIDLDKITCGSSQKIWWKCSKCGYEWKATPKNRIKGGTGCPICGLKKIGINHNKTLVKKRGSLFEYRPDLVEEWDYDKNFPLTPKDVTIGSGKKVWWKCKKCGGEWEATVDHRATGSGCLYCTGQRVMKGKNDLVTTYPELLVEWDYEKNNKLGIKPENFTKGSNTLVFWKCAKGHSWKASINHRTNGTGCPKCSSANKTSFPEQALYYYLSKIIYTENRAKKFGQEIDIYIPSLNIGFEYDGQYYHNNDITSNREKNKNKILSNNGISLYRIKESNKFEYSEKKKTIFCVFDRNYYYLEKVVDIISDILNIKIPNVNINKDKNKILGMYKNDLREKSFIFEYPELLEEWDYEKNKDLLPESLSFGSNIKVWWKCKKCGSSYQREIGRQHSFKNCPYCSGKKVNLTNSLASKYKELVNFWDYKHNKNISPDKIYYSSRRNVWWICERCGKSYQMKVCARIKAKTNYCFDCKHKHIGDINRINSINRDNILIIKRPDLVKEWIYAKNLPLTPENVTIGSGKKVWWKCSICGNEWEAVICNRTNGNGCPKCNVNGAKNNKIN